VTAARACNPFEQRLQFIEAASEQRTSLRVAQKAGKSNVGARKPRSPLMWIKWVSADSPYKIKSLCARRHVMRRSLLLGVAVAMLSSTMALAGDLPGPAAAPPPPVINGGPGTKVGMLDCKVGPSVGFIVVGFRKMSCRFIPDNLPGASEMRGTSVLSVLISD